MRRQITEVGRGAAESKGTGRGCMDRVLGWDRFWVRGRERLQV